MPGRRIVGFVAAAVVVVVVWQLLSEGISPAKPGPDAGGTGPERPGEAGSSGDPQAITDPILTQRFDGGAGEDHAGPGAPEASQDELFAPALLARFREDFTAAWMVKRKTPPDATDLEAAVEDFKKRVLALPASMGTEAAVRANETDKLREALAHSDGNLLVDAAQKGIWKPERKDLDGGLLDKLLGQRITGAVVAGGDFAADRNRRPDDGLVLDFGPGAWTLDERRLRGKDNKTFPADLTLQGAGINATVLMIGSIGPNGAIKRLRIRDLTIDCGNNYFFDLRSASMTLDLLNVRIIRFDMGAGGSLAFSSNEGALIRAVGCEFLGGYGRHPSSGTFWQGGTLIAQFTGCRFSWLDLRLSYLERSSLVVFTNCSFDRFREDPEKSRQRNVQFEGCTVGPLLSFAEYHRNDPIPLPSLLPWYDPR